MSRSHWHRGLCLTLDQLDAIDRGLNKSMALARVLASGVSGDREGGQPPEPEDIFLMIQVQVEELEKVWKITRELGKKLPG